MIPERASDLREICHRRSVQRLSLFGSVLGNAFDPAASDLDFVVEFSDLSPSEHADCYFGLQEDLQRLFGRPVDLVEPNSLRNPYFRQAVEETQQLVYAAS